MTVETGRCWAIYTLSDPRVSPEVRARMSEASKKSYAERKAAGLVKSQVGKRVFPEARAKMSVAAKARQEHIRLLKAKEGFDAI